VTPQESKGISHHGQSLLFFEITQIGLQHNQKHSGGIQETIYFYSSTFKLQQNSTSWLTSSLDKVISSSAKALQTQSVLASRINTLK